MSTLKSVRITKRTISEMVLRSILVTTSEVSDRQQFMNQMTEIFPTSSPSFLNSYYQQTLEHINGMDRDRHHNYRKHVKNMKVEVELNSNPNGYKWYVENGMRREYVKNRQIAREFKKVNGKQWKIEKVA